MKTNFKKALSVAALTVAVFGSSALAKSVKVTLTQIDDQVITGFVVTGDATRLVIAQNPNAPSGAVMPNNRIKNIYWEEPEDWKAAWKLWTRRDYAAAAPAFEALAKTYANLVQIEDSFGSKAKYHQAESLRRTGQYAKLLDVWEELKAVNLSDSYQKQIALFNYWGHVGKKLWGPLKLLTNRFEMKEGEIPSHTVPPSIMPLKEGLEANLLIQIAYMRGIATEMLAREEHKAALAAYDAQDPETHPAVPIAWARVLSAMPDYGRVYTLTYMSERMLAMQAMERSMAIIKEDPKLKDNYTMQKEAYALASFYKDLFGNGKVPAGYEEFLIEPKPPEPPSDTAADDDDEEDAKPKAAPEKDDKKADDKKDKAE